RRRHTRFSRDWSSDVCSSDLQYAEADIKHGGSGTRRSGSGVGLFAGLDVDRIGVAGLLRDGRLGGGFVLRVFHAFLEAFDRTAEILADVTQFFRAEDQGHDDQDDQPVPDAEATHEKYSLGGGGRAV